MEATVTAQRDVVLDSFGSKDLVTDNETDFVCKPGRLNDLQPTLSAALASDHVGANAISVIDRKYAWPRVARQLDKIHTSLIS